MGGRHAATTQGQAVRESCRFKFFFPLSRTHTRNFTAGGPGAAAFAAAVGFRRTDGCEMPVQVSLIVPQGRTAGQQISFVHTDGRNVSLILPNGVVPGQTLHVNVPDDLLSRARARRRPARSRTRRRRRTRR